MINFTWLQVSFLPAIFTRSPSLPRSNLNNQPLNSRGNGAIYSDYQLVHGYDLFYFAAIFVLARQTTSPPPPLPRPNLNNHPVDWRGNGATYSNYQLVHRYDLFYFVAIFVLAHRTTSRLPPFRSSISTTIRWIRVEMELFTLTTN